MDIGLFAPSEISELAKRYFDEHISNMETPLEKRFQQMHLGHLAFLREGEEKYITSELIKLATLRGAPDKIIDRVHALEDAGITNIALNVCGTDGREMIREFGNEVISKL